MRFLGIDKKRKKKEKEARYSASVRQKRKRKKKQNSGPRVSGNVRAARNPLFVHYQLRRGIIIHETAKSRANRICIISPRTLQRALLGRAEKGKYRATSKRWAIPPIPRKQWAAHAPPRNATRPEPRRRRRCVQFVDSRRAPTTAPREPSPSARDSGVHGSREPSLGTPYQRNKIQW